MSETQSSPPTCKLCDGTGFVYLFNIVNLQTHRSRSGYINCPNCLPNNLKSTRHIFTHWLDWVAYKSLILERAVSLDYFPLSSALFRMVMAIFGFYDGVAAHRFAMASFSQEFSYYRDQWLRTNPRFRDLDPSVPGGAILTAEQAGDMEFVTRLFKRLVPQRNQKQQEEE
ncbi:MAG: hypothetical protein D6800_11585 [Candidatus Zixiibacteriota bacterium]|nr:MAG: hypothetical protein D6800_11585 [candidate division Zixibacteria bacterium]